MIQSLQALFKQATRRRLRIRAGLVIACWLLLNLQLAVAAHHGGQQQPVAPQAQPNTSTSLELNALPAETTLLVVSPQQEICAERMDWHTPPVTGPPAEIRFCRFRE